MHKNLQRFLSVVIIHLNTVTPGEQLIVQMLNGDSVQCEIDHGPVVPQLISKLTQPRIGASFILKDTNYILRGTDTLSDLVAVSKEPIILNVLHCDPVQLFRQNALLVSMGSKKTPEIVWRARILIMNMGLQVEDHQIREYFLDAFLFPGITKYKPKELRAQLNAYIHEMSLKNLDALQAILAVWELPMDRYRYLAQIWVDMFTVFIKIPKLDQFKLASLRDSLMNISARDRKPESMTDVIMALEQMDFNESSTFTNTSQDSVNEFSSTSELELLAFLKTTT